MSGVGTRSGESDGIETTVQDFERSRDELEAELQVLREKLDVLLGARGEPGARGQGLRRFRGIMPDPREPARVLLAGAENATLARAEGCLEGGPHEAVRADSVERAMDFAASDHVSLLIVSCNGSVGCDDALAKLARRAGSRPLLVATDGCKGRCALRRVGGRVFECLTPDIDDSALAATIEGAIAHQRWQRDLRIMAEDYDRLFRGAPFGIFRSTREGRFLEVNRRLATMCGYDSPEEMVEEVNRRGIAEALYVRPASRPALVDRALAEGNWRQEEVEFRRRDGSTFLGSLCFREVPDEGESRGHLVGFVEDVTERESNRHALQEYAETQSVLIREINHRVKNNLTAILGILHKELAGAQAVESATSVRILRDLIGRVQGLSTVHGMLSRSRWQPLEVDVLCRQVIADVMRSVQSTKSVRLDVSAGQERIPGAQAHHLTLILNELATNSVKHACGDRPDLAISIDIQGDGRHLTIVYRDDGPGYPQEVLDGEPSSDHTGMDLIQGIATHSLGGRLHLRNAGGAVAEIAFQIEDRRPMTAERQADK